MEEGDRPPPAAALLRAGTGAGPAFLGRVLTELWPTGQSATQPSCSQAREVLKDKRRGGLWPGSHSFAVISFLLNEATLSTERKEFH